MPYEKSIPVDRIFLDLKNPRHEPLDDQEQVITYLCNHESVTKLADDIVKNGLSPLEQFAVFREGDSEDDDTAMPFIVAEGNRRLCAIILLNDPQLAPQNKRKTFEQMEKKWSGIQELPCVIFAGRNDPQLRIWMTRKHAGEQDGVGPKSWNAEQKQRYSGTDRNRIAQAVLDYAQKRNFISEGDRKGKLTTVQRYISNSVFRNTIGVNTENLNQVCRDRPQEDFDLLLQTFIGDLLNKKVHSRANADKCKKYAQRLENLEGLSRKRIEPESLSDVIAQETPSDQRPQRLSKRRYLPYEEEINNELKCLKNYKLQSLYYSICKVSLDSHTPLVAIGAWVFFETLSARAGRNSKTSFDSFFNNDRLKGYGFSDKQRIKPLSEALKRIANYGNTTKHDEVAATFNGDQLANDMEVLKPVIIGCVKDILSKNPS